LTGLYEEKIKPTVEQKSTEFKDLVKENFARGANTQQAIVAILLAVFLLLALAFF
ncbi:10501_t:CDS:1, partial [Gigaspora rosea]